ncbi:MAG: hypothetical protein NT060_02290, partial [Candidatus Omnitrophica bacterium]|nr:hypothetical protein [Candidatus Omnitrophota bacterium]
MQIRNPKSLLVSRHQGEKLFFFVFLFVIACSSPLLAQNEIKSTPTITSTEEVKPLPRKPPESPLVINADKVEYLSDSKDVSAEGNVVINYKGSKLTCSKIIV